MVFGLVRCGKDDDNDNGAPSCEEFTSENAECYCEQHPESGHCKPLELIISEVTEKEVGLTPHASNGTLWTKGFAIGNVIYIIDRESEGPKAFWKYDLDGDDEWIQLADFPGDDGYGLTGAARGRGYASQNASGKFWEYDPASNEWIPIPDLPFTSAETHWVEYNDRFYVPHSNGIYEFDPTTKEWAKISDQTSTGFGAVFLVGDDMYWYNINSDFMSHFNFADKSYDTVDLPEDFGSSVSFNCPFVIKDQAYVVVSNDFWSFNNDSKTWTFHENGLQEGAVYGDDVFIIDGRAYLVDNGYLKIFE